MKYNVQRNSGYDVSACIRAEVWNVLTVLLVYLNYILCFTGHC